MRILKAVMSVMFLITATTFVVQPENPKAVGSSSSAAMAAGGISPRK